MTAAEKDKRVTQMGNLIHASENYHRVVEIVRSGAAGEDQQDPRLDGRRPHWVGSTRPTRRPRRGCDYNFWLGPAPERPFNPNRFTFNWRWFWDYGGGMLTDFCCHIVDLVHWGMEVDAPKTIVGDRRPVRPRRQRRDARHARSRLRVREGRTTSS